jgi:ADP-heptose:LPS heptosyltransferase
VLDRSPLLNLLPWLAGAKIRAGINSQGRGFALNVFARLEKQTPLQHEAAVYLEVARGLSANITGSRLEFYPSEEARLEVAAFLAHNIAPEKPLAVIHPGGGHNPDTVVLSKRWPPERFAAIAARLVEYGYNVAITGASDDRCLVDELCNHLPETARPSVISAAGRFDIDRNGALFEKARLFVGNDTGLMHLAVACGARVVAIFGPSNPLAYGPYTSKGAYVAPPGVNTGVALPLSEYQKLSAAQGGIGSITVEQVWEKVIALLES